MTVQDIELTEMMPHCDGVQEKPSPSRHQRCVNHRLEVLLVFVFIMAVVAIIVSFVNLERSNDLQEQMERRSGLCIICSELYPDGYADSHANQVISSLKQYTDHGVVFCCARSSNDKEEMMKLQLKRRDSLTYHHIFNTSGIDPTNVSFGSISAHKVLRTQPGKEPDFEQKYYMLHIMEDDDPRYEHVNGVTVKATGLEINYPGLYFVYKSIFFVPDTNHPCKGFKEQTFRSMLLRNTTRREKNIDVLLRSEHTCCPDCARHRETTFTGGVFYLDQGDLLQVEISAYGLVYFKQDVTFMGLVMMNAI